MVHSITYSSRIVGSYRSSLSIRTEASLRWQRLEGRAVPASRQSSAPKSSSVRFLVQIPGSAAKMSRAAFTKAAKSIPSFRDLMEAYVQAFLEQVLVSVACNGAHSLKQRLSRWLLMMRDRSDGDTLMITQNLLAEMLGVQRPTITNTLRELKQSGCVAPARSQVTILDREGLMKTSCACYQLVRMRTAFHLPKTYTT